MLAQTSQIRMTLSALEHNIKVLLREREQCEKVKQENEELKEKVSKLEKVF